MLLFDGALATSVHEADPMVADVAKATARQLIIAACGKTGRRRGAASSPAGLVA
jgi:hypothetical protein